MKWTIGRVLARPRHQEGARMNWNVLVKQTVSRFARGNIAAQNARILLPDEQEAEHKRTRKIAQEWKARAST